MNTKMEKVNVIKLEDAGDIPKNEGTDDLDIKDHILPIKLEPSDVKTEDVQDVSIIKSEPVDETNLESKKYHSCDRCEETFSSKKLLTNHKSKAHRKTYDCDICGKSLTRLSILMTHKQRHEDLPRQVCDLCGKTFKTTSTLERHKQWQHMKPETESFVCKYCNKIFPYRYSLEDHVARHEGKRDLPCTTCGKKFFTERQLKKHQRYHSSQSRKQEHLCEFCGRMLGSAEIFNAHRKNHLKRPFACDVCGKTFGAKFMLDRHAVRHKNGKKFTCGLCGKSFCTAHELNRHWYTHSGERRHKCFMCNCTYSSRFSLNRHIQTHQNQRYSFKCEVCEKRFNSAQNLNVHKMCVHQDPKTWKYECVYCEERFPTKFRLVEHVAKHTGSKFSCIVCDETFHSRLRMIRHRSSHLNETPLKCNLCQEECGDIFILSSHKRKAHNVDTENSVIAVRVESLPSDSADRPPINKTPWKCNICEEECADALMLRSHQRRAHRPKRKKEVHECPTCGKRCSSWWNLKGHQKAKHRAQNAKHRTPKPKRLKCDLCDKTFHYPSNLKKHKAAHTELRPFKCTFCDKTYKTKWALKAHFCVDRGDKSYDCGVCGKSYTRKSSLTEHFSAHTRDQKFRCRVCLKVFGFKCRLERHMLRAHQVAVEMKSEIGGDIKEEIVDNEIKTEVRWDIKEEVVESS